jgi:hypothetical protein
MFFFVLVKLILSCVNYPFLSFFLLILLLRVLVVVYTGPNLLFLF